jgi:hypothetical protein
MLLVFHNTGHFTFKVYGILTEIYPVIHIYKKCIFVNIRKENHYELNQIMMIRNLLFSIIFTFSTTGLLAQQQLPNPGFENWENVNVGKDEPVSWSAIKTSDNASVSNAAPVNWDKSTTAHSGNFSLKLENLSTIIGAVATGGMTNGRFHTTFNPAAGYVYSDFSNNRWNTPFTGRPDSVVVWVQYQPQGNDTLQAKFLLHVDSCSIGIQPQWSQNVIALAKITLTGTHSNWVRLSAPFVYNSSANPEYILAMLTSGAGLQAVAGSVAWYDDVELIYNPVSIKESEKKELDVFYSDGQIRFRNFSRDYLGADIQIYDLSGRKIYAQKIDGAEINLSSANITKGVYIISVINNGSQAVKKLVIY